MDWVRTGLNIGVGRWKALLIAFCLFSATVMAIETVAAVATFARGTEGRLGVKGEGVMHDGRAAVSVTGFEPWSLAPQAGLRVGDVMLRERWVDGGRHLRPGESVAVTLVRDGVALPARVPAVERPIDALERWHFGLSAVLCWSGTLLGLVIGLRQAGSSTSRALSLAFLWWSANLGWGYAPAFWPAAVVGLTQAVALAPGWYLGLWFAIHYPDERPQGLRRALRRVLPVFLLALVAVELAVVAWAVDRGSQALFSWTQLPYVGAAGLLMLVSFWDGWRRSSGELRQRFSWLLGSFALMWSVSYATWIGAWAGIAELQTWLGRVSVIGSLLALCGLTYAILRHRVLDMGLALNRSLVFAVVGAVLLGSFQFLNVMAGRLLHFDDPAKAGLLTAVLAGFVVLAYPKVKPRAEWLVDRLFFGAWGARSGPGTLCRRRARLHRACGPGHGAGGRARPLHQRRRCGALRAPARRPLRPPAGGDDRDARQGGRRRTAGRGPARRPPGGPLRRGALHAAGRAGAGAVAAARTRCLRADRPPA
jgi:hypothetical protein